MAVTIKECTDYIIESDREDALSDAVNLLRNIGYADGSEEAVRKKIESTIIIRQKDMPEPAGEIVPDTSVTCGFIREKYSLGRYAVCSACSRNGSATEQDAVRERNFMQALFDLTACSGLFPENSAEHEYILSRFSVYEAYRTEGGLSSYMLLNKSIYEAVYTLVRENPSIRKNRTAPLRSLIAPEEVMKRWEFYNPERCGDEFTNGLVKIKIDFYHNKGCGDSSVIDYFLPPRKKKERKKPAEAAETRTEQAGEQSARERAIEFDDINVLFGGEITIDRTEPVRLDGRESEVFPTFTEDELARAGYERPGRETLENISYYALRKKKSAMDIVRISATGQPAALFSIQGSDGRYIIDGGQICRLANYLDTRKEVMTKEPVTLFAFMLANGQRMRLSVVQAEDRKSYFESVMKKKSFTHFSMPATGGDSITYHRALAYSAGLPENRIVYGNGCLTVKGNVPAKENQNTVRAAVRTPLSADGWHDFRNELFIFLAQKNQFAVQNMCISSIAEERHEIWFNVEKEKCRGFTTILSGAASECIKKKGYYPDIEYTIIIE